MKINIKKIFIAITFLFLGVIFVSCGGNDPEFNITDERMTIEIGEVKSIQYELEGKHEIEWTFSPADSKVIKLENNKVTGLKKGEVTVTAKVSGYEVSDSIIIEVTEEEVIEIKSVSLTGDSEGFIGSKISLSYDINPKNAYYEKIVWSSSDVKLATVKDGVITLIKEGTVTITINVDGIKNTHKITITKPKEELKSVTISGENNGLIGETIKLSYGVNPIDADYTKVTWSSSDEKLATIKEGVVTLIKEGVVTISLDIDGVKNTHKITVTKPEVKLESVTIKGDSEGFIDDQITLTFDLLPLEYKYKKVTWKSSDEQLATVEEGIVKLLKKGVVTISVDVDGTEDDFEITIKEDTSINSIEITGVETGLVGEQVTLVATVLPEVPEGMEITWSVNISAFASIDAEVVTLLRKGKVVITASIGDLEATHTIDIKVPNAKIGTKGYVTIQDAIDNAVDNDVITILKGTHDELLNINKSNIKLTSELGKEVILTNRINIAPNMMNISITNLSFTENINIVTTSKLTNFTFKNNHIYDTNLESSGYLPNNRNNINAIIQLGTTSGSDLYGDIYIEDNIFENIKSDIISIHRTMLNKEISIRNNEFRNYEVGAIRFDGGYNNGTYFITGNTFENDIKQAETAILFRSYSSSEGNIQTINIEDNIFKNIGNEENNPTDSFPASAVIATSTWNSKDTYLNIRNNEFINTHNSVHLRKNETTTRWHATVTGNTFDNPTGYTFYEDGQLADYSLNTYLDVLGEVVSEERIITEVEPSYRKVYIEAPVLQSFVITGLNEGEVYDDIHLILEATPPYFVFENVLWTSSNEDFGTVSDGKVRLLAVGTVVITATYDEHVVDFEITISEKIAATIGEVEYLTIQSAIDAAASGDIIQVRKGLFDEVLVVDKPLTLKGASNKETTLTNKITIESDLENITISGFNLTGDFQVKSNGTLTGFVFTDNNVYDTSLKATPYAPSSRTDVNAIIQLSSMAGTNKFGDISIVNNTFNGIQSDIIAIHRTMFDKEINIVNNEFRNFEIGAIRFDGGYNNGIYNIKSNVFENDLEPSESAIIFRAYAPEGGKTQTINIEDNVFKNVGNQSNNPTGSQPASTVIGTSTWNSNDTSFNVLNNEFINTHNSLHLRKNESTTKWNVSITGNTFTNPTGYIVYEDGNLANIETNIYLNNDNIPYLTEELKDTRTTDETIIKVKDLVAEYYIITYIYNEELGMYDVAEEVITGVVGETITIHPEDKLGYYTDFELYEGIIVKDNSLVIEIYYELIVIDENAFEYELELNGGNFVYPSRDALVRDFVADYNLVTGKSYTLENLNMGNFADNDYHLVFFDVIYRDKWLWLADYLGVVGSSTNRNSARDILTSTSAAQFTAINDNWRYAFSYEMRGFLKGIKFDTNAYWMSADYSQLELANGFWSKYSDYKVETLYLSKGENETLPTEVFKDGFEFIGWYDNETLEGEPLSEISETMKLYAKYEEKNPVTSILIKNPIDELLKGDEYQLEIEILPLDAFNKNLYFYTSDIKVATVTEEGLIKVLNDGQVLIKVTNHNGDFMDEMSITVNLNDDLKISFNNNYKGYLTVGDEFSIDTTGVGETNKLLDFTYQIEDGTLLEVTSSGTFKAIAPGKTTIDIISNGTVKYTYAVNIYEGLTENRIDKLLKLLAESNNSVVTGVNVVPYYTVKEEWVDSRYESLNVYLFDDFEVDRVTYLADPTKKSSGLKTSTEFVLVHDTANLNGGLINHGNFFKSESNSVSIHYTTGDYGILQTLEDDYIAWHAGDGTGTKFEWIKTGVTALNQGKPNIDISLDGYFTFNGEKSTVLAPKKDGQILDKSYFTYLGPTWDIFDGEYVIGTTYFTAKQQSRGVIASHGGNNNSIGIEMNVNTDGDIIDTVQRTAKLVANLLEENNLPNHRVIMHNTTDGKGDPYTLNNTVYNGTFYFERFMEHVALEREILVNYSDAKITLTSESDLVSSTGRVIIKPEFTTEVEYTITVEIDGVTKSITLTSVIPGLNTWNQYYGFHKPTQPWAKKDYRPEVL